MTILGNLDYRVIGLSITDMNKSPILNKFRILSHETCNAYQIEAWSNFAIARGVQLLDLFIPPTPFCPYGVPLPHRLFTSTTLVHLRLNNGICIHLPEFVCLPSLRKLHLASVRFENDDSLPCLISGCLVLRDLVIERLIDYDLDSSLYRKDDNMTTVIISSPTIKCLTLIFQSAESSIRWLKNHKLHISTPALEYLHVVDQLSPEVSIGSLSSLVQANICLCFTSKLLCKVLSLSKAYITLGALLCQRAQLCSSTYLNLKLSVKSLMIYSNWIWRLIGFLC